MIGEVELFFDSIVHEDHNVLDLMTADYSFVNERLARHYGIPGIYGSQFRRVTLTDDARRGLLGKGAILLATSHAHRTSPVLRGKWVLENIIGVSPAPPPDNVPALSDEQKPEKPRSGRRGARTASRQPDLCVVPPGDGSHRLRARELRRGRRVAREGRRDPRRFDRRVGTACRRHHASTAWWRCGTPWCATRRRSCAR